jgi:flagellar biosynthesis/type III secretory pathway protein FliH
MAQAKSRAEILEALEGVSNDEFDDLLLQLAIAVWLDRNENDREDTLYICNEVINDLEQGE